MGYKVFDGIFFYMLEILLLEWDSHSIVSSVYFRAYHSWACKKFPKVGFPDWWHKLVFVLGREYRNKRTIIINYATEFPEHAI